MGVPKNYPKYPLMGVPRGHVSQVIPAPAKLPVNINITRVKILTSESEGGGLNIQILWTSGHLDSTPSLCLEADKLKQITNN